MMIGWKEQESPNSSVNSPWCHFHSLLKNLREIFSFILSYNWRGSSLFPFTYSPSKIRSKLTSLPLQNWIDTNTYYCHLRVYFSRVHKNAVGKTNILSKASSLLIRLSMRIHYLTAVKYSITRCANIKLVNWLLLLPKRKTFNGGATIFFWILDHILDVGPSVFPSDSNTEKVRNDLIWPRIILFFNQRSVFKQQFNPNVRIFGQKK